MQMWNDLEVYFSCQKIDSLIKYQYKQIRDTFKQLHLQPSGPLQPLKGGADDHVEDKGEKEEKQENSEASHRAFPDSWFSHVWDKDFNLAHQLT